MIKLKRAKFDVPLSENQYLCFVERLLRDPEIRGRVVTDCAMILVAEARQHGCASLSYAQLAKLVNTDKRSIQKVINLLCDRGHFDLVRRGRGNTASVYVPRGLPAPTNVVRLVRRQHEPKLELVD